MKVDSLFTLVSTKRRKKEKKANFDYHITNILIEIGFWFYYL